MASDNKIDFGPRPDLPRACAVASPRSDLQLKSCQVFLDDYCFLGMILASSTDYYHFCYFFVDVKHTALGGLDTDEFYDTGKKISVYVTFLNTTSSEPGSQLSSEPEKLCREPVNLALVIGTIYIYTLLR